MEDLNPEFRPFTIRVENGHCLEVDNQPMLFGVVETLASLPTKEAEINLNAATIRFHRPLAGWGGLFPLPLSQPG